MAATDKAKRILSAQIHRLPFNQPLEPIEVPVNHDVLVVGGGIAGIEAALKLSATGKHVTLVERNPSIGGHMAMFDKTFPTLDCAACILTPKMSALGKDPNITLWPTPRSSRSTATSATSRSRSRKKARYVNTDTCTGCGACQEACVVRKVKSEFDQGMGYRSAIYIPFPQAVPLRATIDPAKCLTLSKGKCKQQSCVPACGPGAIDFEQKDEVVELDVGAIIMATGFELWDPAQESRYGYGRLDNVITSLEFERISNASGPTGGEIVCKNGEAPKSVAILHCVGSRDENYQEFCSRVCCMYSLKFSHLIKEHLPETEVYELYIDMRCFGKDYEEFYKRLMDEGVNFVRGRAAEVTDVALSPDEEGRLVVKTEDTLLGIVRRIPADMVILSSGLSPAPRRQRGLADLRLRLQLQRLLPRAPSQARAGHAPSPTASSSPAAASTPRTSPTRSPRRAPRRPARWAWSTTPRSRSSRPSPTSIPRSARAATSAWACARTTRSSTTKRRTQPR